MEKPAPVRDRILQAARELLESDGFSALSTRTVAAKAGCSIGTIYNHFSDFDEVVLHLNAETAGWLQQALAAGVGASQATRAAALVDAYFDFVDKHRKSWRALFQHQLPEDYELPEWYQGVIAQTVRYVMEILQDSAPDLSSGEREALVVALWSGLHGLASLDEQSKLNTVIAGGSARSLGHLLVRSALRGAGWDGQ